MTPLTVNGLIAKLQTMSPDAQIEYQLPEADAADEGVLHTGDRCFVTDAQETFYNDRENKWIVLS